MNVRYIHSNGRQGSADLKIETWRMSFLFQKKVSWTADHYVGAQRPYFCMNAEMIITTHLKNCFLSRADLKEFEVILQRAGFECLSHEQVKKLRVCPRHRYGLGKYWRPSKLCQYP